jgi:trigger factor
MKTNVEDISPVKKRLMIEIDAKEIDNRVDEAYRQFGKRARVKGFRPGKVPRKILENYFSEDILEDVTSSLIKETLPEALEETKAYPLNMPVIENDTVRRGQDYRYSAVFEVKPEFEIKNYLGIEVEREKVSITEEDVARQLDQIREARSKLLSVGDERGIKQGDVVIIDYAGFDGDKEIEGVKAENYGLRIGDKQFYQGVEEALIGSKKADQIEARVDFEDDYFHSGLAGKSVNFKVKVKDIKEVELPDLDEGFVKSLGDFEDLTELEEKIKEDLTVREQARVEKDLKEKVLGKITDSVDFQLPESLVDAEIKGSLERIKQDLLKSGSSLQKAGLNEARLEEEIRPVAEKRVKGMLVLAEIAGQNGLKVEESDLAESFKEISRSMGQDPETVRRYYEANNLMGALRESILKEKTLKYVVDNAKVTEIAGHTIDEPPPGSTE